MFAAQRNLDAVFCAAGRNNFFPRPKVPYPLLYLRGYSGFRRERSRLSGSLNFHQARLAMAAAWP